MSGWQPLSGGEPVGRVEGEGTGSKLVVGLVVGTFGCMVLFAVVGILAAIAIPNFLAYQLRAKRAEAPSTLDALRTAEIAYLASFGEVLELGPCPPTDPGTELRPWGEHCLDQLEQLGHVPGLQVRCTYEVEEVTAADAGEKDFRAWAFCDLDGDGDESSYSAGRYERAQMVTPYNVY